MMSLFAIINATIIDGTGNDPVERGTILLEDDRIIAVGRQVNVPREATVLDANGWNALPGLIDTHVHFMMEYPDMMGNLLTPPSLKVLKTIPRMQATLDAGITTIRDAGGTPAGVKMAVERGIIPGPRMKVAVSIISQTGGHGDGFYPCCVDLGFFGLRLYDVPTRTADGVEEVRKLTREILRAGADWIKLATTGGVLSTADSPTSSQLTIDEISTAVYEAAAQDKLCMSHAQGTQGIKNALVAGVASIEHGVYLDDEAIDIMLKQGTYLVPTLVAPLAALQYAQAHADSFPPMMAAKAANVIESHQRSFRRAVEAGVKVAMGTDSGVGRHGDNGMELQLMVENGMTPMQSIQASTINAARLLRMDEQIGTLEAGKLADLILVNGDVLNNINLIADPKNVELVFKGGKVVNRPASIHEAWQQRQ
jgi:imidazolonepropionase-like amidohydrolase